MGYSKHSFQSLYNQAALGNKGAAAELVSRTAPRGKPVRYPGRVHLVLEKLEAGDHRRLAELFRDRAKKELATPPPPAPSSAPRKTQGFMWMKTGRKSRVHAFKHTAEPVYPIKSVCGVELGSALVHASLRSGDGRCFHCTRIVKGFSLASA